MNVVTSFISLRFALGIFFIKSYIFLMYSDVQSLLVEINKIIPEREKSEET